MRHARLEAGRVRQKVASSHVICGKATQRHVNSVGVKRAHRPTRPPPSSSPVARQPRPSLPPLPSGPAAAWRRAASGRRRWGPPGRQEGAQPRGLSRGARIASAWTTGRPSPSCSKSEWRVLQPLSGVTIDTRPRESERELVTRPELDTSSKVEVFLKCTVILKNLTLTQTLTLHMTLTLTLTGAHARGGRTPGKCRAAT